MVDNGSLQWSWIDVEMKLENAKTPEAPLLPCPASNVNFTSTFTNSTAHGH
jgi:hypothetical protein